MTDHLQFQKQQIAISQERVVEWSTLST